MCQNIHKGVGEFGVLFGYETKIENLRHFDVVESCCCLLDIIIIGCLLVGHLVCKIKPKLSCEVTSEYLYEKLSFTSLFIIVVFKAASFVV